MNQILYGDCRTSLRNLAALGVKAQTCVTSPPYFGLRDYGHEGQLGLEQSPQEYVSNMVEVFRCVWDVLADDGTLWLNIGDSYAVGGMSNPSSKSTLGGGRDRGASGYSLSRTVPDGLKAKDLIGIPWRVAFALQADGWYLRQDIIWHKPNPLPESVRDRCTKAHEYLFLLSKSDRYYFDSEAMKEPATGRDPGNKKTHKYAKAGAYVDGGAQKNIGACGARETRNRRSVWTVATRPYKGAHFAVFPPALIEPCVLAGSRPGDTVLDPFMGSGTTAAVAKQHSRQYLGCELNPTYAPLIEERLK